MSDRLFVYGTLHPDRAPAEIADVVGSLRPLGEGTIKARRFDLGQYPGIVTDDKDRTKILGHVFALPENKDQALAELDQYEEYDPKDKVNSLFRRKRMMVTLADGKRGACWVYVYNRPIKRGPSLIQRVRKASTGIGR
jgi:gamma-glutamylcyclotransferase (GGCT)/AIG2-like uncharacterized protein YtfP